MRIAITGANGQVGRSLRQVCTDHEIMPLSHAEFDITDRAAGRRLVELEPDLVIHAAAMTQVDECTIHPDEAFRVNEGGTEIVAEACAEAGAAMLYVSSNEVFDGKALEHYPEDVPPSPANVYGRSKYAGEKVAAEFVEHLYIVRTSWVFASGGSNFPRKIIQLADERGSLKVVADEIACPTYAPDLAQAIARLIRKKRFGIYHFTNAGYCSRFEFAKEILKQTGRKKIPVLPITRAEFKRASMPPEFTPLKNERGDAIGIRLRPWQKALKAYLKEEDF